jgi:hypothetical protein
MSDENWAHAMRRHDPPKKKTATPEAKVTTACDAYLKLLGILTIRTNAGSWSDEKGNMIMGAKGGTSDKTLLLPGGRFAALELKAGTNTLSDAQKRYKARVVALGGLFIEARCKEDVRAALVVVFGEQTVNDWETLGKARAAEQRKAKRNY